MKVGILTYHAACNFGANLQVLSTVKYFQNRGLDVLVINWYPIELELYYQRITPQVQIDAHRKFRDYYLPLTDRCITDDDIVSVIEKENISVIVVGSDAVAQHHPILSRIVLSKRTLFALARETPDCLCPNPFWGSFLKKMNRKIPMAMMSVSSQNSPYGKSLFFEKKELKKHVANFKYISTRDDWTSEMFTYATGGELKPIITPDPVFAFNENVNDLLPSKEYILDKFNLTSSYYLFSFHKDIFPSDWLKNFKNRVSQSGISCVALPFPSGIKFKHPFDHEIDIPLNPIDWYSLIKYSCGYIGHNMHPIVVSLTNNIPCFSFDNYGMMNIKGKVNEKSSKIYHILSVFGHLQNRVCSKGKHITIPTVEYVIDSLNSFDKVKNQEVLTTYIKSYERMMKDIEIALNIV